MSPPDGGQLCPGPRAEAGASRWRICAVFDQPDHAYFPCMAGGLRALVPGAPFMARPCALRAARRGTRYLDLPGSLRIRGANHTLQGYGRLGVSEGSQPSVPRWGLGGSSSRQAARRSRSVARRWALVCPGYQVRVSDLAWTRGLFVGGSVRGGERLGPGVRHLARGPNARASACIWGRIRHSGRSTPQW